MDRDKQPGEKETVGVMTSIIIVVLVIFIGAFYFSKLVPAPITPSPTVEETDGMVLALSTQGTSDEIADIQKDIDATPDLSTIGVGLAELQLQ